jgi:hypothetical protein
MKIKAGLTLALLALAASPSALLAQDQKGHPLLTSDFLVSSGVFFPRKEFKLAVNGSVVGPDEPIDFGDAIGFSEDDSTFAADFTWHFGEKWSVAGQYWQTSDSTTAMLEEDVHWQDVVFKQGTFVGGNAGLKVARLFLGRSFSKSEVHEFGLGLGLHWLEVEAGLEGQILTSIGDSEFYRGSVSADAPLPNIGGWYTYAFSPRWAVYTRLDWLSASIGDYSGGLWNLGAGVNWAFSKHVGVTAAYNYFNLDIDVEQNDWNGSLNLSQNGPFLSLTANW